jgi:hypothetical protein
MGLPGIVHGGLDEQKSGSAGWVLTSAVQAAHGEDPVPESAAGTLLLAGITSHPRRVAEAIATSCQRDRSSTVADHEHGPYN